MEPAIRRRMFKCPEWAAFVSARRDALGRAGDTGRLAGAYYAVRGVPITVHAQPVYRNYPPKMMYFIGSARLTPKLFAEYYNDLINAKEGWQWQPL